MDQRARAAIVIATLLASPPVLADGEAGAAHGPIVVTLSKVHSATGMLRAALYRTPESFRKEAEALQVVAVAATPGRVEIVFSDLSAGRYAIMAYHDENADGKLNLRLGMFPTEAYGLSNNPKIFGPPKFADSAFEHDGRETTLEIELRD